VIVFKSIEWKNLLSTGNSPSKVLLNKSTSTLIVGRNGEGKSTILDALCFSLFGKPFRNINKPQLINSINGKNCLTTVEFSVSGKEYKIIRGIKPNVFEIWCDGVMINQDAAAKDYQKVLEQQILKLNYKTFTQVVILGSASFVPFMQLPSNQRRDVIEDILDIKIFSTMNQLLKERANATKDEIARIESAITVAKSKVDAQTQLIKTINEAKTESIRSLHDKVRANDESISVAENEISALVGKLTELKGKVADKNKVVEDIEKAKTIKSNLLHKTETCEDTKQFFHTNEVCPSCEQGIAHEHKQKVIASIEQQLATHTNKVSELEGILEKLNAQLKGMNEILDEISDLNIEISTKNSTITLLNKQNKALNAEIEESKADTSNIDEEKAKLKELAQAALEQINKKTALNEERQYQELASNLLKDTGIKTTIIREYLPAMNKLINKYLSAMDFYVHFELDETFNEIIRARHRDEFTYESFSEGEKMRIDLAILFTWRQIAKMKNSVNTNLLILDEIFDSSLDVAGTDYFLTLMNAFDHDTNVFVISHKGDQLFDKFRSVIRFEKKNDFSVLV
jgi:DNA repair exonuclease SbcCD ATPase subunit